MFKQLAARLPSRWQREIKRVYYGRQMRQGTFVSDEADFDRVHEWVKPGDWIIDIGANVGHYTRRFSDLVGPTGRVLAFEPVPFTFSMLAANVERFPLANVTLFNTAVSERFEMLGMSIPDFDSGLTNYYEAHLVSGPDEGLQVMTLPIDGLPIERRIALVKIDSEGHEREVLAGMATLIDRDHPILILETESAEIIDGLKARGYRADRHPGSPNVILMPA